MRQPSESGVSWPGSSRTKGRARRGSRSQRPPRTSAGYFGSLGCSAVRLVTALAKGLQPALEPFARGIVRVCWRAAVVLEPLANSARAERGEKFVKAFAAETKRVGINRIPERDHPIAYLAQVRPLFTEGGIQSFGVVRYLARSVG